MIFVFKYDARSHFAANDFANVSAKVSNLHKAAIRKNSGGTEESASCRSLRGSHRSQYRVKSSNPEATHDRDSQCDDGQVFSVSRMTWLPI